jgi:transcription antitermination protein NusB
MDPRHLKRIKVIQNLFAYTYCELKNNLPFPNDQITLLIIKNIPKINQLIIKYAPKYPVDKMAKIDLVILWLAIYELTIESIHPKKVIINEAVELAKEMGGENSFAFVNAVLGKIIK